MKAYNTYKGVSFKPMRRQLKQKRKNKLIKTQRAIS